MVAERIGNCSLQVEVDALGHIMFKEIPDFALKISRDMFDGDECLCVHLYSNFREEKILSATIKLGEFVASIDPDIFKSRRSAGTGTGICSWAQLVDEQNGLLRDRKVKLEVDVYQHTNEATMTIVQDPSNAVCTVTIENVKGLSAVAIGLKITGVPGTWNSLAHKDSEGQLMLRLGCQYLPPDVKSVELQMEGKIKDEQEIDYSDTDVQTFTRADTNDMIFEHFFVDQHDEAVIKYTVQVLKIEKKRKVRKVRK